MDYMDLHCFISFFMDLRGSGARMFSSLCRPVAACAALKTYAAAGWLPYISRFHILEAWIWRPGAWMLDAGRIGMDWRRWRRWRHSGERGLEEILTRSSFRSSADFPRHVSGRRFVVFEHFRLFRKLVQGFPRVPRVEAHLEPMGAPFVP